MKKKMGKYTYIILTSIVVLLAYEIRRISQLDYVYPEIGYSIEELVKSLGYQFEQHSVVTEDGYILELHRILSPNPLPGRPPIFLMHGLACSSITWLLSADKSLPVYLAKEGFDVWLGNTRGNSYARKHLKIDPDADPKKFFDFSWHEIGTIDVPTMIDYVLEKTQHEKLYYVGHSQGSVVFYVMMSEKPEYNGKVEIMIALAPVVYTRGARSFIYRVSPDLQDAAKWVMTAIGMYEMMPQYKILSVFGNAYCRDGSWLQILCDLPFGIFCGFNAPGLNSTLLPLMITHFGAGSSTKQSFHYTQLAKTNKFQKYDHGLEENILRYGQSEPPFYYLNQTTVPVAIFWSYNDLFVTEHNIKRLHTELPNVVSNYKIPDESFNHLDYLISFTAEKLYYPMFRKVIEQHESRKIDSV